MTLTHAGLFEGYGGTTMAAETVLGPLETLWVSEIKPAACTLLEYRKPGVRNLGDMRLIHAARHGRIDVMTASWPCQPHSSAGKRLGEADPRALWPYVAEHIRHARPAIFLGENVARITSNGELRRVVRSLAALGYVGAWRVQRASDAPVYGCHQRARCFIAAVDPAAYAERLGWAGWGPEAAGSTNTWGQGPRATATGRRTDAGHLILLPTPTKRDQKGPGARRERSDGYARTAAQLDLAAAIQLLPTPTQSMTTGAGTSGRDGGLNLQTAALTLLPTPSASSYGTNQGGAAGRVGPVRESLDTMARNDRLVEWGPYAESIARWGANFDREAPPPTQLGRSGKPQLAPGFVEWMMGLPQGWVCDVPDLAPRASGHRNAALSLLGDGVMPQQGAAAYRFLLDHLAQRLASERVA